MKLDKRKPRDVPPGFLAVYVRDLLMDRKSRERYMFTVAKAESDGDVVTVTLSTGDKYRVKIEGA